ncbi:putative pentatricopeptide [Medicago truncatula]|uniref:Pentatricopeptide (PPR) repeat protein n=1 Tax=Medicago truncatula TaxID=3880 RepID=A0A072TTG1_MEDTR|nr:pentatricopeptide (PPR) repeat protein [Medicago truncatula]RHN51847.1 putative pentatricopeptide [Medicago truncatula]
MKVIPIVNSYNIIINGLCKIKIVDEALNLFTEMHCKPNTVTYNSLIDLLCKSDRVSDAWKLLDQMHDRGQRPNVITYTSLLHALCKNHHVDKAIGQQFKSPRHSTRYTDIQYTY